MHTFQLFIQACSGSDLDPGYSQVNTDSGISNMPSLQARHKDLLIFRSSVPGCVSFRCQEGSFFIQELTKVVNDSSRNVDLDTITKLTKKAVTDREAKIRVCSKHKKLLCRRCDVFNFEPMKQTPNKCHDTLLKPVYLKDGVC